MPDRRLFSQTWRPRHALESGCYIREVLRSAHEKGIVHGQCGCLACTASPRDLIAGHHKFEVPAFMVHRCKSASSLCDVPVVAMAQRALAGRVRRLFNSPSHRRQEYGMFQIK
jgi:hypothetical protein